MRSNLVRGVAKWCWRREPRGEPQHKRVLPTTDGAVDADRAASHDWVSLQQSEQTPPDSCSAGASSNAAVVL
jgi:nicotinamidase-related amidase